MSCPVSQVLLTHTSQVGFEASIQHLSLPISWMIGNGELQLNLHPCHEVLLKVAGEGRILVAHNGFR